MQCTRKQEPKRTSVLSKSYQPLDYPSYWSPITGRFCLVSPDWSTTVLLAGQSGLQKKIIIYFRSLAVQFSEFP